MTMGLLQREARPLARFIAELRDSLDGGTGKHAWNTPGIEDALHASRNLGTAAQVAHAAIEAASNPANRTPAVIPLDGPHWRGIAKRTPPADEQRPHILRCSVCSEFEEACRARWAGDHEFQSRRDAQQLDAEHAKQYVDGLRIEKSQTAPRDPKPEPTREHDPRADAARAELAQQPEPQPTARATAREAHKEDADA